MHAQNSILKEQKGTVEEIHLFLHGKRSQFYNNCVLRCGYDFFKKHTVEEKEFEGKQMNLKMLKKNTI